MASCRIGELWKKDVVCVDSGVCLGRVDDVEVDVCTAQLTAIVIYGRSRLFGLLGREEDTVICWQDIQLIGEDTVLVRYCPPQGRAPEGSVLLPGLLKRCGYNGFYLDFSGRDFSGGQQSVTLSEDGFPAAQSQTEEKAPVFPAAFDFSGPVSQRVCHPGPAAA